MMLVHGWADICQIIPTFHANNLYNQLNLRHSQYIDYAVVQHFSICFFIGWHELRHTQSTYFVAALVIAPLSAHASKIGSNYENYYGCTSVAGIDLLLAKRPLNG